MSGKIVNIAGQRFGRLVVQFCAPSPHGAKGALWFCQCDCGKAKFVRGALLRRGVVRSCGCLHDGLMRNPATNPIHKRWKKSTSSL
jgi:hypothetical protein